MSAPVRLDVGAKAPAFTLVDQHGKKVKLSEYAGAPVLVFFYPKALTGGCTNQACGLRDVAGDIGDVAIVGISPDEPARQAAFDDKHGLGYPLLSDPDHKVADRYGVWGPKKLYGREYEGIIRSAFLVDARGRLAEVWYKISPKATVERLVAAVVG